MPLGFIKKIFSSGEKETEAVVETENAVVSSVSGGQADPVGFVEFIVTNLVSQPQSVKIESSREGDNDMLIMISCDKNDMGRVIGKRGKTISAIRSLAVDAAGRAGIHNLKVELED